MLSSTLPGACDPLQHSISSICPLQPVDEEASTVFPAASLHVIYNECHSGHLQCSSSCAIDAHAAEIREEENTQGG